MWLQKVICAGTFLKLDCTNLLHNLSKQFQNYSLGKTEIMWIYKFVQFVQFVNSDKVPLEFSHVLLLYIHKLDCDSMR